MNRLILFLAALAATTARAEDYTILLFEPAAELALRADPAQAAGYWGAYGQYAQTLTAAKALTGGMALATDDTAHLPATGETAGRIGPGDLVLSGYFTITAPDRATADALLAQAPTLTRGGATELRASYPNPLMAQN